MTVASLSEKRRLLREQLLRKEGLAAEGPRRISRRVQPGPAPLSFGQQRLWFLHQLDPEGTGYNLSEVVGLEGRLDPGALGRALAEVVRRHEVLRTAFPQGPSEEPVPTVAPTARPALLADLAGLPPGLRTAAAAQAAAQLAAAPFDLERGPVLRAALLRLGDDHVPGAPGHVLALALHHIATDGWSMGLLLRELITLYEAFAAGEPSPLPELPLQYADFAAWQREHLSGPSLERHLAYWKERLAGAPTLLKLPTDRPWPSVQSFRGGRMPVGLGGAATAALRDLARREGATPFMVVLAALGVLLHRYSRQDEVLVGAPTANRGRPELEGLIGFFVNTLTLQVDLRGGPRFTGLVSRVRETVLGAEAHQDLPFEQLVDALDLPRDLSRTPLFQVLLAYQNLPSVAERPRSLAIGRFGLDASVAQFELSFFLSDDVNGLNGELVYRSDLFDAPTAQRLARHFEALLEGAVLQPGAPVPELPLLAPAERHQLLTEWNDTAAPQPPRLLLHALFEDQAARTPDATAVVFEGARLSYGELDRHADRLALHLRGLGVGAETRVAVCAERSLEIVVGLLAVLKTGGAYVPVDPEYPRDRVAYMLEDAEVCVLLTQRRLAGDLPAANRQVVELDGDWGPGEEAQGRGSGAEPESLAYVIYTSGSTGRPKGAGNAHRGIVNRLLWMQEAYGLTPEDRVLQKTPFSFDVSVWEFFWPLITGARLVMAKPGGHQDPGYLVDTIVREGITTLHFVPSMLQAFVEQPGMERCASLKRVIASGEALPFDLQQRFFARLATAELHNLYGPTEAAVDVTFWPCERQGERRSVPIGRPVANTRIHLLDPGLRPVPVGVLGELWISGVQVGRGYYGRPELTAERFVPDPFSPEPGARFYRTGDLARYGADSAIEYDGRIDYQVKVRGFRIELGEIEAVLLALPGIREAVVLAREDQSEEGAGDRRLVAYVVGDAPADALRQALRERLPEYMVPAAFVLLSALPLTPNGKVDRKALPAPEWQSAAESYLAPRTPVEEVLAGLWAELLGLERVGASDHFFALGGHSLLATRILSRLRSAFSVEMPLRDLFEAPVLADLAARVEAALRAGSTRLTPPLVPIPREGSLPLSFAQQRLWFIDQLDPGTPLYNIPVALRAEGRLDPGVLALCLGEITRRHGALRTVFATRDGAPVQVIRPPAPFPLSVVDLSGLPEGQREALLPALVGDEASRPFDLARGPLLRGTLLRLVAEDHVAALTMHHIVSDAWSIGLLVREVTALYAAFAEGRPSPLPELPVQYADFAAWQHSWLHGEVLEEEISFWRQQLAGLPPRLELPTDRPRPAVQSFRGASRPVRLPAGLTTQAQALGRREGATLFMALLAGFQALLARHSGQDDLAVGTPVAGRNRIEIEGLIGFFINTLVLRGDLAGEPSFRKLLGRARETTLAAHMHQDVPFERLVQELAPERSLAQTPLFQVMLALQNAPSESLEIQDLRLRPVGGAGGTEKFDLTLTLGEHDGGLSGSVGYATDLFDAATIDRLIGHFERLLAAAIATPELSASALPLLSETERHQFLTEWNDTAAPQPPRLLLHALFEDQAARTPDATAVVFEGARLSYGELDRHADRLALHLRGLGVGAETRVAVCAERSLEIVVGLLAVLKAGGAYVPVDPEYPRDRVAYMLEDAGVRVLLTQRRLAGDLPAADRQVVELDGDWGPGEEAQGRGGGAEPESLAYVIYTSGSTGRPKGVQIQHRSLAGFVVDMGRRLGIGATDRLLSVTSLSFDIFGLELFVPLACGAQVRLASREAMRDGALLARMLEESGTTVLQSTPATWRMLLEAGWNGTRGLKLLCGGEALPGELAARLLALPEEGEGLCNLFGPTETTIWSAVYRVEVSREPMPIGRPIGNTELYVLDDYRQPAPVGVEGELYIGGAGLARGYLHRGDLTAERFVPNPFAGVGARLYRTGDLARSLPDGKLEFLGRIDYQVKVRGFRIEPGEIEVVLLALPGIREAVVLAREDRSEGGAGDRRLVAYVVGDAPADALRQALRERLPEYMVPAAFVLLSALPLTPNGKVDRKALPAPEPQGAVESHLAPRTPVEEVLAGLWAELLGLERVGASDHFFQLGGHSLLATRVMSRLRSAFGIEMPLRELFEAPMLADLAARVEVALRTGAGSPVPPLVPLAPRRREGPLPLSFAQQRLWFIDQLEPGNPLYNIPMALRVQGPLDCEVMALSLGEIVRRHEALRTIFAVREDAPVQVIRPAAPFELSIIDLSGLPDSERETVALTLAGEEASRPFDLARGPLLRGLLLRMAEGDHVAALTMHHIVSDGWSMGILVREVTTLYAAFVEGRPSPLPELPLQYADFAVWQHSWLHGEVLEDEISFWRRQLAGLPPRLELPTDHPRPAVRSFRGASRPVQLPAELTRQLQALSRREGATLFMVLLAAFHALLARYSGQEDLAVGTPVAGRNREEIEGLIGFFVNTLVLRGDSSGEPSFRELLGRVRETTLAAHTHQDVPFERLVQELSPERSLAHTPLFQVMLALQNAPAENLEIQDLRLRPLGGAGATAKFDLTLSLGEYDGGLSGSVGYATDLFDATTIDRLIGHFERLLAAAAALLDEPVFALPFSSPAEHAQLLREWNDTRAGLGEGFFHREVAAQAARAPSAVAVELGAERWTYSRLVAKAQRLARHLRELGVGPDSIVGLCAGRSPLHIVGLLAVLEAGGAWLPLDPDDPAERLAFLLDDAGARILLIEEHLRERVPAAGRPVVPLDAHQDDLDEEAVEALGVEVAADHVAYVIYTSGSTGRPKGVAVRHGSLMNLIRALRATVYAGTDGALRIGVNASFSFDGSVKQIAQLAWGHTLHLLGQDARLDPAALVDTVRRLRLDVLDCTPSQLRLLLEAGLGIEDAAPALVLVGGEAMDADLLGAALARPRTRFWNVYGPTECTVDTTAAPFVAGVPPSRIGRPLPNVQTHVVAGWGGLAPLGVPGELQVGGAGLARGYLRRPGLTAARFVPDPISGDPGARLYRTGDLVRRLPDGSLDFLGRLDHQVKVRGFRIELGEIEAAIAALTGVSQAAVIVREDKPGDRRLVAYVVGDFTTEALRTSLHERLPTHMVPAVFVKLAALPLSPNGKVDRKTLPAPEWQRPEESYLAPRTPVEEVLAGTWAELLGLERVGTDDHFFDLGGHSLLATRVMSRLRSAFGIEMPLRELFEAPTLADLATRIETALRAGAGQLTPPLVPMPRHGALPLSFAQQRLWFIDQLGPGSPLYNMPVALHVEGPLDSGVLALCLGEIVRRHEVLRSIFAELEGSPVQVILPAAPFALPRVDLSGLPQSRREALALSLAGEEAIRPFDLTRGPLLRGLLLRLAEGDHVVALTMHHIVSDGWSLGILVREITALYAAFAAGRPSPLSEIEVQYADFAVWQHSWLQGEILENEISFWRRQLEGLPPRLELPTDRSRPAVQSFRGATRPVQLPVELMRQARTLGRREGATLFMLLLGGFQALLARYSGQLDLAVGTPVAGRNRLEIEGLIGFFVNTLVLRGDLTGEPSFRQLLGRVRETALAAHTHQDVPFEKLVQELSPERSLAQTPLFQVMFALQNAPAESLDIQDLRLRPVGGAGTTAKFDLTLTLGENNSGVTGTVEHATDLFDATTIDRLILHYERLLTAAVAAPNRSLSELLLLDEAERQQTLMEWNDTAVKWSVLPFLHPLLAAQAARAPERIALEQGDRTLTAGELEAQANRLAHLLVRRGVIPEDRVAICCDRSPEMVVSLLAVWKAGAAWVPLDPAYPAARLTAVLDDAQPSVLITGPGAPATLLQRGEETAPRVLDLAAVAAELAGSSGEDPGPPEIALTPDHLAYVIYTSGSTGRPKGVLVSHGAIANHMLWMLPLGKTDAVLQKTPFVFDAAIWEIFLPLLTGARLVLASPGAHRDPAALAREVRERGVTVLQLVPSLLGPFLDEDLRGSTLRRLFAGGEALPTPLCERVFERLPGVELWNLYGPTEGAIDLTFHPCRPGQMGKITPLGRPLDNVRVRILDRQWQPVPLGQPGELYAGGAGLARGYLGRPDLTAERFVPDPLNHSPGGRLYRTGDLVRWLPDGALDFLGRLDHQVKLRGFRIELGEIESVLRSYPDVKEAVVLLRAPSSRGADLTAFIVPTSGATPEAAELRRFLSDRLPDYMVPSAYVPLQRLPVTLTGKLDRRVLEQMEVSSSPTSSTSAYRQPRDPFEMMLARIWEELLAVERVGLDDNFFHLGGHSLLAVGLISRIEQQFGQRLPLTALFQEPTIEHLSRVLKEKSQTRGASPLIPLRPRGNAPPWYFVHPAEGQVHQYFELARSLGEGIPAFGLQAPGLNDRKLVLADVSEIAETYLAAIREVQPQGPYYLAGWSLGGTIVFEMARRLQAQDQQIGALVLIDALRFTRHELAVDEVAVWIEVMDGLIRAEVDREAWREALHPLDHDGRLAHVAADLARRGLLPPGLDTETLERMLSVHFATLKAVHSYEPEPSLVSGVLVRATATAKKYASASHNGSFGWAPLFEAGLEVHDLPGDHYSILWKDNVAALASIFINLRSGQGA